MMLKLKASNWSPHRFNPLFINAKHITYMIGIFFFWRIRMKLKLTASNLSPHLFNPLFINTKDINSMLGICLYYGGSRLVGSDKRNGHLGNYMIVIVINS